MIIHTQEMNPLVWASATLTRYLPALGALVILGLSHFASAPLLAQDGATNTFGPPDGPLPSHLPEFVLPGNSQVGERWWPSLKEREEVLRRVPELQREAEKQGWDDLELDKFLAACASATGDGSSLKGRSDIGLPTLTACTDIVQRMALPSRLLSALKRYQDEHESLKFWKATGLLSEALLTALSKDFSRPRGQQALDADPFFNAQDVVSIRKLEADRLLEGPTLDIRLWLAIPDANAQEYSYSLTYRFIKESDRWQLVDIFGAPPEAYSLRQRLGLPDLVNSVGMELIAIPSEDKSLPSRWLARTEVTQAQWKQVMGTNPSLYVNDLHPVDSVSWHDANLFCERLTARERASGTLPHNAAYRLPTVAEWEAANRSGYAGGADIELPNYAWMIDNSNSTTHPVASLKGNRAGFHDLEGNVWEWCQDEDDFTPGYRVLRGGCYENLLVDWSPGVPKNSHPPENTKPYFGFRPLLEIPPAGETSP
jgi:hypothetical protein